jgi:hypothetical protein
MTGRTFSLIAEIPFEISQILFEIAEILFDFVELLFEIAGIPSDFAQHPFGFEAVTGSREYQRYNRLREEPL